jgi:hypothetical protein
MWVVQSEFPDIPAKLRVLLGPVSAFELLNLNAISPRKQENREASIFRELMSRRETDGNG